MQINRHVYKILLDLEWRSLVNLKQEKKDHPMIQMQL